MKIKKSVHVEIAMWIVVFAIVSSLDLLLQQHRNFTDTLNALAPTYDENADAGPPFDMYYHLEVAHRLNRQISVALSNLDTGEYNVAL